MQTKEEKNAYNRKRYAANRTRIRAEQAQYYIDNRQRIRESQGEWYAANRQSIREQATRHYAENRLRILDRQVEYSKRHRDKLRASIITRLGGCCVRCAAVHNLEFDHVYDNGYEHRVEVLGRNEACHIIYPWMRDAPLEEVLHGKYAIQLLCNECHRTKDKWSQKPDLFFKQAA